MILLGAAEGWVVAKDIAAAGVPVIVDAEANIPAGLNDLAATYMNAARLQAAGVTIAVQAVHAGREISFGARAWSWDAWSAKGSCRSKRRLRR